jgi:hypothetical protein
MRLPSSSLPLLLLLLLSQPLDLAATSSLLLP